MSHTGEHVIQQAADQNKTVESYLEANRQAELRDHLATLPDWTEESLDAIPDPYLDALDAKGVS